MVSALTFPYRRPRRSDSRKKKTPRRPPPLKLDDSFFKEQSKKKSGQPAVKAVRGEVSGPTPNKDSFTMPVKMEVSLSDPGKSTENQAMETPKANGNLHPNYNPYGSKKATPEPSILLASRPVSPQESLRTIIQLDGHDSDSDPEISPMSEHRAPARSGSVLSKFFPELSGNHLLVSPMSDGRKMSAAPERPIPRKASFFEHEIHERVQTLYSQSADVASDEEEEDQQQTGTPLGQKTGSSSGSDEILDDASSCYSRRSSVTSVGTEVPEDGAYNSADAYSIFSPVAAGVFDDAASLCPSRAASTVSRAPSRAKSKKSRSKGPSRAPSRTASKASRTAPKAAEPEPPVPQLQPSVQLEPPVDDQPKPSTDCQSKPATDCQAKPPTDSPSASPSTSPKAPNKGLRPPHPPPLRADSVFQPRSYSVGSPMSMDDLKNKPLPLEPVRQPSPLAIRRESRPVASHRTGSRYTRGPSPLRTQVHHSNSTQQPCQTCGGCADRQMREARRGTAPEARASRRDPTFNQAAEELEDTLAGLGKSGQRKQQTMLILDAPLQVRRHNGEWVATRPAPAPPTSKPYSGTHANSPLETARSVKKDKYGRTIKKRPSDTPKDRRPSNLDTIREGANKDKQKKSKSQEAEDKLMRSPKGRQSSSPGKMEESKKDKGSLKRSFITMPSFSRRQPQPQAGRSAIAEQRLSVLSSHSETSLGPPPEDTRRLSQASLSESNLESTSAPSTTKRDDLMLQLPRLQTHDLDLKNLLDHFTFDQGLDRSATASPTDLDPAAAELAGEADAAPPSDDLPNLTPPEDEKIPVNSEKMRQNQAFVSTAQASSVHVPPEVYELAATPPSPTLVIPELPGKTEAPVQLSLPPNMSEDAIVSMMESISSLDDLFNLVLVNRRFYNIFKKRELPIIKNALFKMSPPAWELREMSPPWITEWQQVLDPDTQVPEYTPSLYLDRYAQDIFTLAQLKSMILVRCAPFLRRETVRGLSGMDSARAEEVDDAFWRIWTFCRIFGTGKGRENDMEGQRDWLKGGVKAKLHLGSSSTMTEPFGMNNVLFEPPAGFAHGNKGGLSPKQLYDMTEIWTCLGVLLQPLHAKCAEARDVGIFDGMDVPEGDTVREETVLEEWTSWVLTLGLTAVLTLSSLSPAEATASTFIKAKELGLTKWELTETETSRSSFLKEAVSRVYEDQERSMSTDVDAMDAFPQPDSYEQNRERQQALSQQLRARRQRGGDNDGEMGTSFSRERPMSEFSTIVHNLNGDIRDAPPVPPVPALMVDRSSTSTASTAPRTPNHTPPPPSHSPEPPVHFQRSPSLQPVVPPPAPSFQPQVLDPVDRAMDRLVIQLGFNETDVKWALKITDTGEGIDVEAAEQLLKQQKKKQDRNPFAARGKQSLLMSVMKRQGSQDSGWRWAA